MKSISNLFLIPLTLANSVHLGFKLTEGKESNVEALGIENVTKNLLLLGVSTAIEFALHRDVTSSIITFTFGFSLGMIATGIMQDNQKKEAISIG
jgi:hypothetical protein